MITISLCMIVKNESDTLGMCLDSISGLMDEIIIVDTGSTDNTKDIAAKYTNQIYDFKWIDDFSAARNFSFSKATMDYIYTADADEIIDKANYEKFADLKECMMPEVEIVQMKYINDKADNNLQNSITEYRPKLFKRLRNFTWIDAIHETIRLEPVVFDSDISILHRPVGVHSRRDFEIFNRQIRRGIPLSKRIRNMYARELLNVGECKDFEAVLNYFKDIFESQDSKEDEKKEASCVLARGYRLIGDKISFFKYALKDMLTNPCAEICYDIGEVYFEEKDYLEAAVWYYNAAFETECILNIHTAGDLPLIRLAECYEILSRQNSEYKQAAEDYKKLAQEWKMPTEL
ncbi:MAG: glycosyltransferase family 2 protein [Lachnospiraceae bacterium]|nr:glycosyltransferase family 2 protein [Lachnospiraceae bacterium]MDE6252686.1 glycosyltransferase family 2 protein [Lachnospiraceae bacterium]